MELLNLVRPAYPVDRWLLANVSPVLRDSDRRDIEWERAHGPVGTPLIRAYNELLAAEVHSAQGRVSEELANLLGAYAYAVATLTVPTELTPTESELALFHFSRFCEEATLGEDLAKPLAHRCRLAISDCTRRTVESEGTDTCDAESVILAMLRNCYSTEIDEPAYSMDFCIVLSRRIVANPDEAEETLSAPALQVGPLAGDLRVRLGHCAHPVADLDEARDRHKAGVVEVFGEGWSAVLGINCQTYAERDAYGLTLFNLTCPTCYEPCADRGPLDTRRVCMSPTCGAVEKLSEVGD